jgi:pimeloyl-ACP methyl ester carboxylesterase
LALPSNGFSVLAPTWSSARYIHPISTLKVIDNVGHCPHLSAPTASSVAMDTFLARTLRYAAPM